MKDSIHKRIVKWPAFQRAGKKRHNGILPSDNFANSRAPHRTARIIAASIVLSALILAAYFPGNVRRTSASNPVESGTATVAKKDFVQVLRLTGTTEAVKSRPVLAPRLEGAQLNSMVVTKLAPAGSRVKTGDVLVEFDRQAQIKDALDKKATYQDLVDQVEEKRAAEDAARAKDETELKQAEDDLTKAQLEVTKNDIVSRIDAEKNQETLQRGGSDSPATPSDFSIEARSSGRRHSCPGNPTGPRSRHNALCSGKRSEDDHPLAHGWHRGPKHSLAGQQNGRSPGRRRSASRRSVHEGD